MSSEFRAAARQALRDNWGIAAVATFLYLAIFSALSSTVVGCLIALLILPLEWGYEVMFLKKSRGESKLELGGMFRGFSDYGRILGTMILRYLYVFLWSLLFVVPGIIKSYSYSMTNYILNDEPELAYNTAIEKSMAMMDGHKFDLFVLQLTFIGWWLLFCILTFGIGFLWINPLSMAMMGGNKSDLFMLQLTFIGWLLLSFLPLGIGILWLKPYMSMATVEFYKDVKAEYEGKLKAE